MAEKGASDSYRLFVALEVSLEVKATLLREQTMLRTALSKASIRWTSLEHWHLTMRFLGRVPIKSVPDLSGHMAEVCGGFGTLSLFCKGLGVFPPRRAPRVIWAGVKDKTNELSALHQRILKATDAFTAEKAEKSFVGHVTLARCKEIRQPETTTLLELSERLKTKEFGSWAVREVLLMRSELLPAGTRHSVLDRFPLGRV